MWCFILLYIIISLFYDLPYSQVFALVSVPVAMVWSWFNLRPDGMPTIGQRIIDDSRLASLRSRYPDEP